MEDDKDGGTSCGSPHCYDRALLRLLPQLQPGLPCKLTCPWTTAPAWSSLHAQAPHMHSTLPRSAACEAGDRAPSARANWGYLLFLALRLTGERNLLP